MRRLADTISENCSTWFRSLLMTDNIWQLLFYFFFVVDWGFRMIFVLNRHGPSLALRHAIMVWHDLNSWKINALFRIDKVAIFIVYNDLRCLDLVRVSCSGQLTDHGLSEDVRWPSFSLDVDGAEKLAFRWRNCKSPLFVTALRCVLFHQRGHDLLQTLSNQRHF